MVSVLFVCGPLPTPDRSLWHCLSLGHMAGTFSVLQWQSQREVFFPPSCVSPPSNSQVSLPNPFPCSHLLLETSLNGTFQIFQNRESIDMVYKDQPPAVQSRLEIDSGLGDPPENLSFLMDWLIWQIFPEHLLCVRHWAKNHEKRVTRQSPFSPGASHPVGETEYDELK